MRSDIGLPGLLITAERETWGRVHVEAEPMLVVCPKCGSDAGLGDPALWKPIDVADTPWRGRPTTIHLAQFRYHCSPCNAQFVSSVPGINSKRQMTERLVRYIENEAPRRPRAAIAKMVGIEPDPVHRLVLGLAGRLREHHRFPTPRILGVDDIKMNKRTYHMFTDTETGRAVGFVEASEADQLESWVRHNLDASKVEVLVSDLGGQLTSLGASPLLRHAIHVADRWHILQACQKAMLKVIAQEIFILDIAAHEEKKRGVKDKQNEPKQKAKTLRAHRRELLGRRRGKRGSEATLFDEQLLAPILFAPGFERIGRAFWARIDLAKVHRCDTEAAAQAQLQKFRKAASYAGKDGEGGIAEEFKKVVESTRTYERVILNYLAARARFPDLNPAAFTTSSTENRNGVFRKSWRAAHGATNFDYLRLLALYEPWQLDLDIVECGERGCHAIEGPVSLVEGLVGQEPGASIIPRSAFRCLKHSPSAAVRTI